MKWQNYEMKHLQKFINTLLSEYDYTFVQVEEGCLGLGDIAMLPPDDKHYYFLIREIYLNEWSSGHQMMKCRKLPKSWEKAMAEAECEAE